MRTYKLGNSDLETSVISLGCMRISKMGDDEVDALLAAADESGINFYDHADIYGGGNSTKSWINSQRLKVRQTPKQSFKAT